MTTLQTSVLISGIALIAACGGGGGTGAVTPPTGGPPTGGATLISDIQGSGDTSPLEGQTVTVTGLVTGDFQDGDGDATRNLG